MKLTKRYVGSTSWYLDTLTRYIVLAPGWFGPSVRNNTLSDGSSFACECLTLLSWLWNNFFFLKVHFRRIIAPHTDTNLGDCSFLDTCRHMKVTHFSVQFFCILCHVAAGHRGHLFSPHNCSASYTVLMFSIVTDMQVCSLWAWSYTRCVSTDDGSCKYGSSKTNEDTEGRILFRSGAWRATVD